MEIEITLDRNDWDLFLKYCQRNLIRKQNHWTNSSFLKMYLVAIYAFMGIKILEKFCYFHRPTAIATLAFSCISFISIAIINQGKLRKAFKPNVEGIFIGTHKFIFSDKGFESLGKGYKSNYEWSIVKSIEKSNGLILIFLDTSFGFVFPEKKLLNSDEFYNYILEKSRNAESKVGRNN